jgi:hypothetical protein
MERHTARYASFDTTLDGLRMVERLQRTGLPSRANQQVRGCIRVCAPFKVTGERQGGNILELTIG